MHSGDGHGCTLGGVKCFGDLGVGLAQLGVSVDQANGRWTVTIGQSRSNLASFKGGLWGSFRHRGTAPGPYAVVPTPTGARAWGGLGDRTSQLSV